MKFKRVFLGYSPKEVNKFVELNLNETKEIKLQLNKIKQSQDNFKSAEEQAEAILKRASDIAKVQADTIVENAIKTASELFSIEHLSSLSNNALKEVSNFSVYKENGKGILSHSICQLGGCDFDDEEFPTFRDALVEAARLSLIGKKPDCYACSSCYAEYMRDAY